jgi:hypothetical protein
MKARLRRGDNCARSAKSAIFVVEQRPLEGRHIRGVIRNQPARPAQERGVADRLLENCPAYSGPQYPLYFGRDPSEIEVMQDGDPEDHVDRAVVERQIVGRRDAQMRLAGEAVQLEAPARDADEILREIHAHDARAATAEQHRVLTGAAAEVEYDLVADVTEEMVGVFERIGGFGRRRDVPAFLRRVEPEAFGRHARGLVRAAFDLGPFPVRPFCF